jgi:hypothetical protein
VHKVALKLLLIDTKPLISRPCTLSEGVTEAFKTLACPTFNLRLEDFARVGALPLEMSAIRSF